MMAGYLSKDVEW
jgi:hypothetical protein